VELDPSILNDIARRLANGEKVSDEEIEQALRLVREARTKAGKKKLAEKLL